MSATLRRRRAVAVEPESAGRLLLSRLLQENAALVREVSELRLLRDLAFRDPLTGLRNRRFLDARLGEELGRAERNPGVLGSLIVLDLDGFGSVNEQHGRAGGDAALRWLAQRIPEVLRTADVCCRTGGDEFMIILPDTDRAGAETAVVRLTRALDSATGHRWLPLGFSSGVATWPADAHELRPLVARATAALADDKQRQRGRRVRLRLVP